jgi:hypothetical protein
MIYFDQKIITISFPEESSPLDFITADLGEPTITEEFPSTKEEWDAKRRGMPIGAAELRRLIALKGLSAATDRLDAARPSNSYYQNEKIGQPVEDDRDPAC